MSEFENYFTNPNYTRAYGFNRKGLIYIENERDAAFWEEIIEATNPNCYDIKRSVLEGSGKRGKRSLEKLYGTANKYAVIAIDADFDYLCPNKSDVSSLLSNRYILHTFSYSRESVICNKETINDTIKRIRLYQKSNFNIDAVLSKYSSICHKVLSPYLFLLNKRDEAASESCFHKPLTISVSKENPLFTTDFSFNFKILDEMEVCALDRLDFYMKEIDSKGLGDEYIKFQEDLSVLGLNEKNAYRYISGHLLYDNIVSPILKHLKNALMSIEIEHVKAANNGKAKAIKDGIEGVRNHFSNKCSFTSLMDNCNKTQSDDIYLLILDKARKLNDDGIHGGNKVLPT